MKKHRSLLAVLLVLAMLLTPVVNGVTAFAEGEAAPTAEAGEQKKAPETTVPIDPAEKETDQTPPTEDTAEPKDDAPTDEKMTGAEKTEAEKKTEAAKDGEKRGKASELFIIHTNDIHGHVERDDENENPSKRKIGFDRFVAYVKKMQDEKGKENVLVLDAGDATQGTNFTTLSQGSSIISLMNDAGFMASVPGNHEFDYSLEKAFENHKASDFPWYASNVFKGDSAEGELVFKGGEVREFNGRRVGIFGMATPETKFKANPKNTEGLYFAVTVEENAQIAQKEIDRLKGEGAEYIIMLAHIGCDDESDVNTLKLVPKLKGLDLLIDGHSHTEWDGGHSFENGTLGVSTGCYLNTIGTVTVSFGGDGKSSSAAKLLRHADVKDIEPDPATMEAIKKFDDENAKTLGVVLGKLKEDLDGVREHVRGGETNLGDLITDALLEKCDKADLVITNGGGIRASIDAGEVTVGHVFTVLPFGNSMTVIEVSGQDVLDALTFGIEAYPNPAGKFPHIAGATFEIKKEGDKNIPVKIMIGGKPLDKAATYRLATNDFMAVGGDGYTMFTGKKQVELYGSMAEIVQNYIKALADKAGAEGFTYSTDGRIKDYVEVPEQEAPTLISGGDQIWRKGTEEGLSFVSSAELDTFKSVKLDGNELMKDKDYTVVSGSTRVTLNASVLGGLEVGSHELVIESTTGAVTTTFMIAEAEKQPEVKPVPKTPDQEQPEVKPVPTPKVPEVKKPVTKAPKTGDAMLLMPAATLLFSAGALITLRKRKAA